MNVKLPDAPVRPSAHEVAQRDLILQVIVERTERAGAWGRIVLASSVMLVFFISADWGRINEPVQALAEVLVTLFALAFSWWVLALPPQGRVATGTGLLSVTIDALLAFGSLATNVLDPGSDYTGVLHSIDVSIALLLVAASAFRMRVLAVWWSAAVNGAGIVLLVYLDQRVGIVAQPNKILIFLLYLAASVALALMAIYLARIAVGEAALRTLREERARQGVQAILHEHHDLKSLMSDVRLNVERMVERTSDVAGLEPLARRVSSRIEGFGQTLDHARGRVLAILEGDESVEQADVNAAIAQVTSQFCDSVQLISRLPAEPSVVHFPGGTKAMTLLVGHLVFNAIKGHDGRGAQCVTVIVTGSHPEGLEVRIEDDGPGFCPEFLRSFAGLSTPSSPLRGLSLARSALHDAGGTLSLRNLAAGGAQVCLRLPTLKAKTQT